MSHFQFENYDGGNICPDWWPRALWNLHGKFPWPGGPINKPPIVNDILCALLAHTSSYHLGDTNAAKAIRSNAINSIRENLKKLEE